MRWGSAVLSSPHRNAIDTCIECRTAKSPNSGMVGDGKIFITHLEQSIRIRTEESGSMAI